MYFIQGADQKEYGPITAEQLRQWIGENRLNRTSLARKDGDATWRPLAEFSEFADAFGMAMPGTTTFASPSQSVAADPSAASRKLAVPAIAIIVMSALGILGALTMPLWQAAYLDFLLRIPTLPPQAQQALQEARSAGMTAGSIVQLVIGIAFNIVTLIGGIKMKSARSYGLSMASAILIMLPCAGCCCLIGLPFGIWALVVMNQAEVKAAFR